MNLRDGDLYAQVAFSAAPEQGFRAGGHGVLKGGSAWMPDNQVNGVDFVLPFRFADGAWHLGTRGPVTLRIAEVINLVTAKNITADLQGRYPWTEEEPLLLTDVSAVSYTHLDVYKRQPLHCANEGRTKLLRAQ